MLGAFGKGHVGASQASSVAYVTCTCRSSGHADSDGTWYALGTVNTLMDTDWLTIAVEHNSPGNVVNCEMDIAIYDGSNYDTIIPRLLTGWQMDLHQNRAYLFPIRIPAGSNLYVRGRVGDGLAEQASLVYVALSYGYSNPGGVSAGGWCTRIETLGPTGATRATGLIYQTTDNDTAVTLGTTTKHWVGFVPAIHGGQDAVQTGSVMTMSWYLGASGAGWTNFVYDGYRCNNETNVFFSTPFPCMHDVIAGTTISVKGNIGSNDALDLACYGLVG